MITRDQIKELRMAAANQHARLMGDASACVISKSGQSFPAGKFWEGQTAALGELMRSKAEDLLAEAERLRDVWANRPIPGREREVESYRSGGLQALTDVVALAAQE